MAYDGLVTDGYKHHRVHHHQNEFARGKTTSTALRASGVSLNSEWPNSEGCGGKKSCCTSKNVKGAGTIAVKNFTTSSSPTSPKNPPQLHKTPTKFVWS